MDRGHIPIRTCLVCAIKKPKRALLRLCVDPAGDLVGLDPGQTGSGRGAYVCAECLPRLRMSSRLRKAFRRPIKGLSLPL